MPSATDIRKGSVLVLDGELYVCVDFQHNTPGNLRANVQAKLKHLQSGRNLSRKFSATEKVEFAFLDRRPCEYLYKDGANFVFMDSATYEQHHINEEQVADQMRYVVENTVVQVTFYEGSPIAIDLPASVELKVAHTDPGIKGDSVSNVFKPATLETGIEIRVPNHINIGDVLKVNTTTGEFLGRVST